MNNWLGETPPTAVPSPAWFHRAPCLATPTPQIVASSAVGDQFLALGSDSPQQCCNKLILNSASGAHGGRPVLAGYIACNAFSIGGQSSVRSGRFRKSLADVEGIKLSNSTN